MINNLDDTLSNIFVFDQAISHCSLTSLAHTSISSTLSDITLNASWTNFNFLILEFYQTYGGEICGSQHIWIPRHPHTNDIVKRWPVACHEGVIQVRVSQKTGSTTTLSA